MDKFDIKTITLDYLLTTPLGENLVKLKSLYEKIQENIYAMAENDDPDKLKQLKMGTILTFAVIGKVIEGKDPQKFSKEDWKDIAEAVSEYAIKMDGRDYSAFVFSLYSRYIDGSANYKITDFSAELVENQSWPGNYNTTGTIVSFICKREMFKTLARGIRGGVSTFRTMADILCEDIGFVYAGVITAAGANITLLIEPFGAMSERKAIGAVEPDWADYIKPGAGAETVNLGSGDVVIDYKFGRINEKRSREEFNNSTTRKYYMRNMSSSGVEIRINGRVLCYNLFNEIWGIEKHNSYNYLLVIVNIKSDDRNKLPKTRTSKNGLREGDSKLEKLFDWIRSNMHEPKKDLSLADHETDLFQELKRNKEIYNPDPNKVIDTEMHVFTATGESKDRVRIDLYEKTTTGITIYEGKKEVTTSKDVYQLRMYWDGLVYDGITPTKGILVASNNPDSVKALIQIVNTMQDASGNNYVFETKTWEELGINLSRPVHN
ncbi:MAG: hypothetical protein K5931_03965 [Lachnospiraceae bacterium]|nr:hypothetical protein [Lachnospiraceae bacterium]